MKMFTITQAAQELGLHPNTLRRWERRGWLILPRNYLGHRIFTAKIIEQVRNQLTRICEEKD